MKESYRKGVANHPDLESCAVLRKGCREALTEAHADWVLSFEKDVLERRRSQVMRKAIRMLTRDPGPAPRSRRPQARRETHVREPGDPGNARGPEKAAGRKGNPQGHSLRARCRGVGSLRSTVEAPEQGQILAAEGVEGRR